jgi:hypothetical protein
MEKAAFAAGWKPLSRDGTLGSRRVVRGGEGASPQRLKDIASVRLCAGNPPAWTHHSGQAGNRATTTGASEPIA